MSLPQEVLLEAQLSKPLAPTDCFQDFLSIKTPQIVIIKYQLAKGGIRPQKVYHLNSQLVERLRFPNLVATKV